MKSKETSSIIREAETFNCTLSSCRSGESTRRKKMARVREIMGRSRQVVISRNFRDEGLEFELEVVESIRVLGFQNLQLLSCMF